MRVQSAMPWQPQQTDRKKALVLVIVLHLGLGLALLHGLAGEPLRQAAETLRTFDVPLPEPPLSPPEPAREPDEAAERESGATDLQALPAPVVQPPPEVTLPTPPVLRTADEAASATGVEASAGAGQIAGAGSGSGLGGSGTGGGGGGGNGGGLGSEARLLSGNLSRGDYRRIRSFGAPRGSAVLAIEVGADGRMTRCLPFTSSGDAALDGELCRLLARTRWAPARDQAGAAVPVALRYVATWSRD